MPAPYYDRRVYAPDPLPEGCPEPDIHITRPRAGGKPDTDDYYGFPAYQVYGAAVVGFQGSACHRCDNAFATALSSARRRVVGKPIANKDLFASCVDCAFFLRVGDIVYRLCFAGSAKDISTVVFVGPDTFRRLYPWVLDLSARFQDEEAMQRGCTLALVGNLRWM